LVIHFTRKPSYHLSPKIFTIVEVEDCWAVKLLRSVEQSNSLTVEQLNCWIWRLLNG
jgi:hypothetical protein